MSRLTLRTAAASLAFGLAASLSGAPAVAKPDLVIIEEDSMIEFLSCELRQPLARGRITIKNIGEDTSRGRLGVLTRVARSLLAVYVPEHLDLMDTGTERSALDPNEQASIQVTIGRGSLKEGRFLGGIAELPSDLDDSSELLIDALSSGELRELQRALRALGHYRGIVDGVASPQVEDAIAAFQDSIGADPTGRLTLAETRTLAADSGRQLAIVAGDGSEVTVARRVPVTLFAVVDPYNVVDESDESNNLVRFTGEITCR